MSRKIIAHVQTDVGRRRETNEDNYVLLENLWGKEDVALLGAIDGVGGYEGGAEAAAMAKTTVEGYLQNFSFGGPLQLLKEAIVNANNAIHQKRMSVPNLGRMSCVLSIAILDAEKEMMFVGHVGDSRGYVFRNGELIKITKDHSVVGMKEDSGYLTEEEAMHHPRRNEISKMLGEVLLDTNDSEQYLEIKEHSFLPGDLVFFCSDGLTDLVNRDQMIQILSADNTVHEKAQQLIDKANELGGKDNITVAIACFVKKETNKKRTYKTIEVPIADDGNQELIADKKTPAKRKKKTWFWLLPVVFLAGFLANWGGTKNFLQPQKENRVDTIYIKDTLPHTDTTLHADTLIQATDTIFTDSSRVHNMTGY